MNLFYAAQRAASGARIFSMQAGSGEAPTTLTAGAPVISSTTLAIGALHEALVLIDQPAPRGRCIFLDHQNRAIRL